MKLEKVRSKNARLRFDVNSDSSSYTNCWHFRLFLKIFHADFPPAYYVLGPPRIVWQRRLHGNCGRDTLLYFYIAKTGEREKKLANILQT